MNSNIETLRKVTLFNDLSDDEIMEFIENSNTKYVRYRRDDVIICEGDENTKIGIVLGGRLVAEKTAPNGETTVVSIITKGGMIGDILSASNILSPVTVIATETVEMMFIQLSSILTPRGALATIQPRLIKNLVVGISNKYFELEHRLSIISAGNLRKKIMLYLCNYCGHKPGQYFSVPHSREQQAIYLGCNRAALSRELALMKKDGLIDYNFNDFKINKDGGFCNAGVIRGESLAK